MTAPAGVFGAIGLPDAPDRAISLLTLIRALHATGGPPLPEVRRLQQATDRALNEPSNGDAIRLPLPLPRALFESVMRNPPATPDGFFAALVRDRRTALLYYGAMTLDAGARAFLAAQPDLVRDIADQHAGILAAFGRSIHISNNRIVVPGGDAAVPLWEELVGARVNEPAAFVRRLLTSREGRIAYMFDAIAHLDPARQRFALGLHPTQHPASIDRLRIVQRGFTDVDRAWSFAASPFGRPRHDAVLLLRLVPVDEHGVHAQPSSRAFWDAAFESSDFPEDPRRAFRTVSRGAPIDAATLVERILLTPPPLRRTRFETYALGVRRFRSVDAAAAPDVVVALRAYGRYPSVMLALERMGVATPAVYVAVARACERVAAVADARQGHVLLAQFQGALAIIGRAARAGRIDARQTEALVTSLAQVEIRDARYQGRIAAWIEQELNHTEAAVLASMADRSPDGDGRRVEWEGLSYVVDTTAGDVARFEQVRRRHGGERLDDVLMAARELRARGNAARQQDLDALDRRVADVMMALAYAPHQGDPSELFPAAAALFRRHDFGIDREGLTLEARHRAPWERPRIADTVRQTQVHGSLLGLDLALARFSVRRLVNDRMPPPPTLNQNDRDAVLETSAMLNPRDLTDADMHAIAAALARGRERIAANAEPGTRNAEQSWVDRLAEAAGVGETRRQVLSWMVFSGNDRVEALFTLAEVLRLGAPDWTPGPAWGMTGEPVGACYCQAFPDRAAWENLAGRPGTGQIAALLPDLILRLAELLTEIGVPAALLPATFAFAAQDFVDEAPAMHVDDGDALVLQARALTRQRVEDYLAAVAARGPLRPVRTP